MFRIVLSDRVFRFEGSGYEGYDNEYGGSAAAGYGQQAGENGHAGGYEGYGNEHSGAEKGAYGRRFDAHGAARRDGGAIYPSYTRHTGY
jgi:hypothetical protein